MVSGRSGNDSNQPVSAIQNFKEDGRAGSIFVSYRRTDSAMPAGRLADLLKLKFGNDLVFMDIDGIEPGRDYVRIIAEHLSSCKVFLAVIGPTWAYTRRRLSTRLFNPQDFVRLELVAALSRDILIIPVLVADAKMPSAKSLPPSIFDLTKRNAIILSTTKFLQDAEYLFRIIEKEMATPSISDRRNLDAEILRIENLLNEEIKREEKKLFPRRAVAAAFAGGLSALVGLEIKRVLFNSPKYFPEFEEPDPDANTFAVAHASESAFYDELYEESKNNKVLLQKVPLPRGYPKQSLTLDQVVDGDASIGDQIVFHAVGCTGSDRGPSTMELVTGAMVQDLEASKDPDMRSPAFLFHLGDVVYGFGQRQYYFDQFYVPFRHYNAPIVAIPGNHDGLVPPNSTTPTLQAFLENFCADGFQPPLEITRGLRRTPQIQPGVFFTFEAPPFVRIIALYSNVLEDPGVIADEYLGNAQLTYLANALAQVKIDNYNGALIIAHHHPIYTAGAAHAWSDDMRRQIDKACETAGVWPHAILSAHAHNYQRLTREHGNMQIAYVICGNGGHGLTKISQEGAGALRTPMVIQEPGDGTDLVRLEAYDDGAYGYLYITANKSKLVIEYRSVNSVGDNQSANSVGSNGANACVGWKSLSSDIVTVDLQTRKLVAG